jgi:hypothetical protein
MKVGQITRVTADGTAVLTECHVSSIGICAGAAVSSAYVCESDGTVLKVAAAANSCNSIEFGVGVWFSRLGIDSLTTGAEMFIVHGGG